MVNVLTSPRRECSIWGSTTFIPEDSILTSLISVHTGYLICSETDTLSTLIITEKPSIECQDLSIPHRSICVSWGYVTTSVIVSYFDGLGLYNMLPPRWFEPSTLRMPGKRLNQSASAPLYSFQYLHVMIFYVSSESLSNSDNNLW